MAPAAARNSSQIDCDVVIIGGGLVGASMAAALDGAGLSVVVVERHTPASSSQPSFDERTVALTYSSRQILAGLGVWDAVADAAAPILDIEVSDRGRGGSAVLSHRDAGTPALGYVVPTRVLGQALHDRLADAAEVELWCPAGVRSATRYPGHVDVRIDGAADDNGGVRLLQARLLILADGGRSPLGPALGLRTRRMAYRESALVTTVRSDRPHRGRAHERFVGSGPLALLPLAERDFAVVWTVAPARADALESLDDAAFLGRLQATFGDAAGHFERLGQRSRYPLGLARVDRVHEPRVIAVGNAAHVVHPVAGQGFNLGLRDVADLADIIRDRARRGADIGDAHAVRRYGRLRRRDTRNVLSFTDAMLGAFGTRFWPVTAGRALALRAIDRAPILRRALLTRTMGLHDRQSRLAAGRPLPARAGDARPPRDYDVVIVGAGLVGATLACLLGETRLRVALLDRAPPPQAPTGAFRLRVNAYNRAAETLLRGCGVWQRLPADRIFPFRRMCVGHAAGDATVAFDAGAIGEPHLGHFIENDLVIATLMRRVAEFANVDVVDDATIEDIHFDDERAVVAGAAGDAWAGRLLVGCDGGNSRVREAAGIAVRRHPYEQRCIVGTVRFDGSLDATAWQRFLPTGPVGLLPLAPGHCSLAWSCDDERAAALLALDDDAFCAELDAAIGGRLGRITGMGQRASFPLMARGATRYVAGRTALAGDAAHVIHPLAGLGANLGFQDAALLAELLRDAASRGDDVGTRRLLGQYDRRRRLAGHAVSTTVSAFNAVFSNDDARLGRLRDGALRVADAAPLAKRVLMRRAAWMETARGRPERSSD